MVQVQSLGGEINSTRHQEWHKNNMGTQHLQLLLRYHHQCNEHELGQTSGDSEGQGGLVLLQSVGLQRVRHDLVTEQQ